MCEALHEVREELRGTPAVIDAEKGVPDGKYRKRRHNESRKTRDEDNQQLTAQRMTLSRLLRLVGGMRFRGGGLQ
jgi:hypothetical protein